MNKAIVIGHDAVNALGLVQSLGREGVHVKSPNLYVIVITLGRLFLSEILKRRWKFY